MARPLGLALLLFACSDAPAAPQGSATTQRLPRVLVVSGANNHDWKWTTPSLARILESSGRFDVEVTDTTATVGKKKVRGFRGLTLVGTSK